VNFGTESTDGDVPYDQTIRVKMPGTGMVVFNRYKLQRVLGRGGMGVVWLADDLKLERPVALKFLPSLIGLDPAAVKELKTETRRGLELSHPNIVRIYDFVDDDDAAAISMEFVDGKTLSEMRANTDHGVFTVEQVSRWLPGVCDALDYAHFQRKVVHRDLKPANIMLTTKDEVAKVADFGIARSLSDTMSRLSAAHIGTSGTLPYMSPQQAMGERPLPTDDVYSLGATIYELLAGKPPFYRGDLPTQINSKVPPAMAERRRELELAPNDAIPKQWEEAIAACLNKDPNMRPSCAGALAEMLGLRPTTGTGMTMAFTRNAGAFAADKPARPKSKTAIYATAALLALCAGGVAVYLSTRPQATPEAAAKTTAPAPAKEDTANHADTAPAVAKSDAQPPKSGANGDTPKGAAEAAPADRSSSPAPAPAATVASTAPATTATPMPSQPQTSSPAPPPAANPPAPSPAPAQPNAAVAATGPATAMPTVTPQAAVVSPAAAAPTAAQPAPATASPAPAIPGAYTATIPGVSPPPAAAMPVAAVGAEPTLPPGIVPAGFPTGIPSQPIVDEPPAGYWTLDQIYPSPPFSTYSAPGRKYLLYRTQAALKERGIYTSAVDGKEGKSTHNAIQLFQAKNGLKPTGLLDLPTLGALQLVAEPDNIDWTTPANIPTPPGRRASGGARYSRPADTGDDDPNFIERASDRLKNIIGR
jgi:hypothetical protein